MIRHILKWFFKSTFVFLLSLPVMLLGFVMVAIALPFRIEHPETTKPFTDPTQLPGDWMRVTLPRWALWWSNEFDGAWGDKRGWWNTYCMTNYKKLCTAFYSMWQWLAVRNPANYWARVVTGVDVSKCVITHLAGIPDADENNPGWSFLVATERDTGKQFHLLQFWFPWKNGTHGIWGRFGWKIEMKHNDVTSDARIQDRLKGSVYRVSPWKAK